MVAKSKPPTSFTDAVMTGIREVAASLDAGPPLTQRKVRVAVKPRGYRGKDVRALRQTMGASQSVFAQFLGTSPNTVRSWEQDIRKPSPMARRFMDEINREPQRWRRRINQCVDAR
jgi:putative transcriptional regulator